MKRIKALALLVTIMIFLSIFSLGFSAIATEFTTGQYHIDTTTPLYENAPPNTGALLTNVYKGVILTVTRVENGYGFVRYDSLSGYINLSDAKKVSDEPADITGIVKIEINTMPSKTVYFDEDSFDPSGLTVRAVYENGDKIAIKGYEIIVPSMFSPGQKTVIIRYKNIFTAQFNITVNRLPIDYLEIASNPVLAYKEGDKISLSGLKVNCIFTDGRPVEDVTGKITINGKAPSEYENIVLAPGSHNMKITYKYTDVTTQFTIYVAPKALTGIEITSLPTKTVFYGSDASVLDFTGLEIIAYYDNNTNAIVENYTVSHDTLAIGINQITISFGGLNRYFEIRLLPLEIVAIEVKPPIKTTYFLGEDIDITGLEVLAVYNSGEKKKTEEYTLSEVDMTALGTHIVTVKSGEFIKTFEVTVEKQLYILGDINMDGSITSADARLALRQAANLENLTDIQREAADVDKDGNITASDARTILRVAANLESLS